MIVILNTTNDLYSPHLAIQQVEVTIHMSYNEI